MLRTNHCTWCLDSLRLLFGAWPHMIFCFQCFSVRFVSMLLPLLIWVYLASSCVFGNWEASKLAEVTTFYAAKTSNMFTRASTGASGEFALVVELTRSFYVLLCVWEDHLMQLVPCLFCFCGKCLMRILSVLQISKSIFRPLGLLNTVLVFSP